MVDDTFNSTLVTSCHIRPAMPSDLAGMLALFPRLAAFNLPQRRSPEDLWRGDAELLRAWATGDAPECLVHVAVENTAVLGVAMARLREELLSHEPSAHLEVIAVSVEAQGRGIGKALMAAMEQTMRKHGAQSMTLHVFANNTRARTLYESQGYEGELLRYIKHFD